MNWYDMLLNEIKSAQDAATEAAENRRIVSLVEYAAELADNGYSEADILMMLDLELFPE